MAPTEGAEAQRAKAAHSLRHHGRTLLLAHHSLIITGMKEPGQRPSDEDLLAAARHGDGGALETLILRYQPRVYRFGLKMCRNTEDASDVVQETVSAPEVAKVLTETPSPTAQCRDVLLLFSRLLEGEIAPGVCADMEMHLERCGHCHGACESLKRTLALCRATSAPELPVFARESVRDAIRVFLRQQTA
jgi:hypothetical protein